MWKMLCGDDDWRPKFLVAFSACNHISVEIPPESAEDFSCLQEVGSLTQQRR
jgi:hypothetical protein